MFVLNARTDRFSSLDRVCIPCSVVKHKIHDEKISVNIIGCSEKVSLFIVCDAEVEAGPQEDRLLRRFFDENKYYPSSRPVANDYDSVLVRFAVSSFRTFELVSFGYSSSFSF